MTVLILLNNVGEKLLGPTLTFIHRRSAAAPPSVYNRGLVFSSSQSRDLARSRWSFGGSQLAGLSQLVLQVCKALMRLQGADGDT